MDSSIFNGIAALDGDALDPAQLEDKVVLVVNVASRCFPMTEKLDVNGGERHPLFASLVDSPDAEGKAGDIEWNFEKFLVTREGTVAARFRPPVLPESDEVVAAIETALGEVA